MQSPRGKSLGGRAAAVFAEIAQDRDAGVTGGVIDREAVADPRCLSPAHGHRIDVADHLEHDRGRVQGDRRRAASRFRERLAPFSQSSVRLPPFAAGPQLLQAEFADCLQHAEA